MRILKNEAGFGVIAVLLVLGLVLGLATGLVRRARTDTIMQNAVGRTTKSFYLAESGVYRGMAEFRGLFDNFSQPSGSDFDPKSFTLGGATVKYQLEDPSADPSPTVTNPTIVVVPPGTPFSGLNSNRFQYRVLGWVGPDANPEVTVRAQFNVDNIPLFQFVAFYLNRLEVSPGPNMFLSGRLHSNERLYLDAGNNLRIRDDRCTTPGATPPCSAANTERTAVQVSANEIWRGKPAGNTCAGRVELDALGTTEANGSLAAVELEAGNSGGCSVHRVSNLAPWNGTAKDGVQAILPPIGDLLDVPPTSPPGRYWEQADLRIVLDLTDSTHGLNGDLKHIFVANADGSKNTIRTALLATFIAQKPGKLFYNDVPTVPATYALRTSYAPNFSADADVYRASAGTLSPILSRWYTDPRRDYRRGGFYDNREGKWLYMLSLDLQELLDWDRTRITAGQPSLIPNDEYVAGTTGGGVAIFMTVFGPASQNQNNYAVRVFDSALLDFPCPINPATTCEPTGVTVASDQAIFVEGDFNVRGTGAPQYDPASFVGDTINVLSRNWDAITATIPNDRKSREPLTIRTPFSTEINAAFLAGVDLSSGASSTDYNGGLENYPRLHEDWSPFGFVQQALNYKGSFVSLGTPRFKNGPWVYGNGRYEAPVRNWDYDTAFNSPKNLPPLTPNFVFIEQILFAEAFR